MKYKTNIKITSYLEDNRIHYQVEGIEYPNLITEGNALEDAIDNAVDVWSLLCVVYEDKDVDIIEPTNITELEPQEAMILLIESEDTDEYRKECDKQKEEAIMSTKKITGFEIVGKVIHSLDSIKRELRGLKFTFKCIYGQFTTFDRYIAASKGVSREELIKSYHNTAKSDIAKMRKSISEIQNLLDTLESIIDTEYNEDKKE